jgi:NADH-quinone oxidoreductase E subunit
MYQEIFSKYTPTKDNLIYILHDIQDNHPQHYISEEAVQAVSEFLNLPANHIYGVITFYSMYSTSPRGKHIIRLCESPHCYIRGSENILRKLKNTLNVGTGETTRDGLFTLELCACLGVCGNAPVMMINDDVYGDLTEDKIDEIVTGLRGGKK